MLAGYIIVDIILLAICLMFLSLRGRFCGKTSDYILGGELIGKSHSSSG